MLSIFYKNKAFTLIELLIVTSIIGILTAIVFPNYQSARQRLALQRAASKLTQDIRRAQEMAMSAQESSVCESSYNYEYGVYFKETEPKKYILFADCDRSKSYDDGVDQIVDEPELEKGITIINLVSDLNIVFTPPDPSITGVPVTITLTNEIGQGKNIKVNEAGLINIE